MFFAFTEEQKQAIESSGMMVVQFKKSTYAIVSLIGDIFVGWSKLWYSIKQACEATDRLRFAMESLFDNNGLPVSTRFAEAKILSFMTGMDIQFFWTMLKR